jgi:ElaB/YqjD/DUF883 family membrane-anchored ribosome-binding protein
MTDTSATKRQLAADFRDVMHDIESLLATGADKAGGEADALRARIRERMEAAKVRVADVQREAVDGARRAAHATDSFVHEHPWQAVGVAAAIGVVFGVLIARR